MIYQCLGVIKRHLQALAASAEMSPGGTGRGLQHKEQQRSCVGTRHHVWDLQAPEETHSQSLKQVSHVAVEDLLASDT